MTIIFQNINLNKKLVFAVLVSTLLISGAIFYSVNKAQAQQVCSVSHDFGSAIPTSLSVSHDFGSAIPTSLSASDDFESGTLTNWQQVSGTWTTGSGFVEQTNNTQGAYESFLFLNQPTNLPSKYEMSVKMMPMSSSASWYQKAGIVFGYQNAQDYYVAGWHYYYQYGSYYGRFSLRKGNTNTELAAANINWTPGQTGDLKLVRDGSDVKVYLDGVLQINYDGATLNGGKIGLYTNDMTARFDNVLYNDPNCISDAVPPTASLTTPLDNGPDDSDPDLKEVLTNVPFSQFVVQLTDNVGGSGIDDSTVVAGAVSLSKDDILL